MVSYIKTQWLRLLLAVVCVGVAIFFALQPAPDTSTLEGTNEAIGYMFASTSWLLSAFVWFGMSVVDWYGERLKMLEAKAEKYDALCELVEALREANKVDRERDKIQDMKLLELHSMIQELHTLIQNIQEELNHDEKHS